MTRSQVRQMVDELAEDVRSFVLQALDAEIWIQGAEAGRVASAVERAFRKEVDRLFNFETRPGKQRRRKHRLRESA